MKMFRNPNKYRNYLLLSAALACLVVLAVGCNKNQAHNSLNIDNTQTPVYKATSTWSAADAESNVETATPTEAGESSDTAETKPAPTATPDVRLDPDDWKNWPIVPTVSERAKEIYLGGIASGNDPHAFSKVGDCQSIREVLLGIYDLPGRYMLAGNDAYLLETVEQFAGSFDRDGYAVKGGYNAATVLSPFWADPEVCLAGETPLACEIRVQNPSVIIISLEVWWDGRTPERYEQYMRNIIEYSIEQGVLPILSTKADNVEGDHSINAATARLAYEYDIPLWNFWLAAQALPFQGIDPERDGFHITVDAWNERSYTALKTLDQVWRSSFSETADEFEQSIAAEVDTDAVDIDFSKEFVVETEYSGRLIFELSLTSASDVSAAGIYELNFSDGILNRFLPGKYQLMDVIDTKALVYSQGTGQYQVVDYSGEIEYSIPFITATQTPSGIFVDSSSVVVAGVNSGDIGLWVYDIDSNELQQLTITGSENVLLEVLVAVDGSVYWNEMNCTNANECLYGSSYRSSIMSPAVELLAENAGGPKVDRSGEKLTYFLQQEDVETLYFESIDNPQTQYISTYGNVLLDYEWSPDGGELAILKMVRSDYFGKATEVLHYVVDVESLIVKEHPSFLVLSPDIVWGADNDYLVTTGVQQGTGDGYQIALRIINPETAEVLDAGEALNIQADQFLSITKLLALP